MGILKVQNQLSVAVKIMQNKLTWTQCQAMCSATHNLHNFCIGQCWDKFLYKPGEVNNANMISKYKLYNNTTCRRRTPLTLNTHKRLIFQKSKHFSSKYLQAILRICRRRKPLALKLLALKLLLDQGRWNIWSLLDLGYRRK